MVNKAVTSHHPLAERTLLFAAPQRIEKIRVVVPVSESALNMLVSKSYLAAKERTKSAAIKHAIESFLSDERAKFLGEFSAKST
jgi:hypothetical protein